MTQNRFDQEAQSWDDDPKRIWLAGRFVEAVRAILAGGSKRTLLDFGCGTGLVGLALGEDFGRIVMVDTSAGMLEVVGEKAHQLGLDRVELCQGELAAAAETVGKVDALCSMMALHHVGDVEQTLSTMAGLLASGGTLCLGDLEPEDGSFHGPEEPVHRGFDPQELGEKLANLGLEVVTRKRLCEMNKPDKEGNMRTYGIFLLAACKG